MYYLHLFKASWTTRYDNLCGKRWRVSTKRLAMHQHFAELAFDISTPEQGTQPLLLEVSHFMRIPLQMRHKFVLLLLEMRRFDFVDVFEQGVERRLSLTVGGLQHLRPSSVSARFFKYEMRCTAALTV